MSNDPTEMDAGRELDALAAEKVMGFELWPNYSSGFDTDTGESYPDRKCPLPGIRVPPGGKGGLRHPYGIDQWHPLPHYSTDIAAAWQVLDAMVWRVGTANIRFDMEDYGRGVMNDAGAERAVWVTIGDYTAFGPAPLAICRAALAAVGA